MSLKITGGNNILREKKERRKCFTGMIKKIPWYIEDATAANVMSSSRFY